MDTRIQQALDGDLPRSDLTPDELSELAETDAMLRDVVRSVPARPLPDLSTAVLQQIGDEKQSAWLLRPRTITLRPVYLLAAAAVIAFVMLVPRTKQPEQPRLANAQQVLIQFKLDAPQAQAVSLAGDFTQWKTKYALTRTQQGVWTIVVPLEPGVHEYAFVVDGERWVPDPAAPAIDDGFGGQNSRVAVIAPDTRSM